eukprot:CAMPEP_0171758160 /NCGR_PEP_ID=MMETSP0991-20121206/46112_1 /TAXON_ID=483369 /ORGANISM="non described non described, Strain CCMP2098" /LENGTH=242 /DNA_ID=CAMNT_0012360813 /DNA_START=20 /DNA_END=748 /DNA_ORIENTATION=+
MAAQSLSLVASRCRSLSSLRYFGALTPTTPQLFAKVVIEVPSMGDSITEGTLVSLEKSVGDAVAQDDVVAVIETDKVNVEVRAPYAGVLTAVLAGLDTDVEVGAHLFEIDTDATVTTAPTAAPTETPATQTTSAPSLSEVFGTTGGERKASIHFLGKEGWEALRMGTVEPASATAGAGLKGATSASAVIMAPLVEHSAGAVELWSLPGDSAGVAGRFRSTAMSAEEMDAVELGFSEGDLKVA